MAELNQKEFPVTLNVLGNPVPGRILLNVTTGDMEWFYGSDPYRTIKSNKEDKYKWKPDSNNSFYNLKEQINNKFTKAYSEQEVTSEINKSMVKYLDSFRRSYYEKNAPQTGRSLGIISNERQPPPPSRSGVGTDNSETPQDVPNSPATFSVTSETFNSEKFKEFDWLKYPLSMNTFQDRILITQKNYVAPKLLKDGNFDTSNIVAAFSEERFNSKSKVNVLGTVILPMPNDISETNVTAWGEDSLSSLAALVGGAALGVAGGIGSFDSDQINTAVSGAVNNIFNEKSAANETIRQLLSLNAAAAITKKFGININPEAFRSRITGTAINPNLELLFQGPKLRSFAFQFKMSPRNWEEARNIRYIIKFFKKGMAAKRNFTDPKAAYFLGAPNVFDIEFKSGGEELTSGEELKSIGKIKTCALQQFSVNYTPEGFYAAYKDSLAGGSQPISVTMAMAFTELTPLYNDNYEDSDTVGWDVLNNGPSGEPPPEPEPAPTPTTRQEPTTEEERMTAGEAEIRRRTTGPITPATSGGIPGITPGGGGV